MMRNLRLSDVERESEKVISQEYLDKVERGEIEQISPHILYYLAKVYDASYGDFMMRAGHLKRKQNENKI